MSVCNEITVLRYPLTCLGGRQARCPIRSGFQILQIRVFLKLAVLDARYRDQPGNIG
jgi:hypothetical protein